MTTDDIYTYSAAHPNMIVNDPADGMTVSDMTLSVKGSFQEHKQNRCSLDCRNQFFAHPERYVQR